jgi:hypothetical protein
VTGWEVFKEVKISRIGFHLEILDKINLMREVRVILFRIMAKIDC